MMTKIILVRHGHVDWISPERFRGHEDLPLSNLGKHQAFALAQRIAGSWKPTIVYASPLSRCVHTANAIADIRGTKTGVLENLIDINYGRWQGLTHDEVRARWSEELRMWLQVPDLARIPGGEILAEVLVRAVSVIQYVLRAHLGETVVLVGHDSINRVILLYSLGLPLSRYWQIKQEPCCVNEIDIDREIFTIYRINEIHHVLGL